MLVQLAGEGQRKGAAMSTYRKYRATAGRDAQEPEDDGRCGANGCPCRGTINLNSAQWLCSAHATTQPHKWPMVTEGLREHDWLIAFIGDVMRMQRECGPWAEYATQFWSQAEPSMCPTDDEVSHGPAYALRMHQELMVRCNASSRRMPPWSIAQTRADAEAAGYRYVRGNVAPPLRTARKAA